MKQISITEAVKRSGVFSKEIPFQLTKDGKAFAEVVPLGLISWKKCEKCGENTTNVLQFKDRKTKRWDSLTLCDSCMDKYL